MAGLQRSVITRSAKTALRVVLRECASTAQLTPRADAPPRHYEKNHCDLLATDTAAVVACLIFSAVSWASCWALYERRSRLLSLTRDRFHHGGLMRKKDPPICAESCHSNVRNFSTFAPTRTPCGASKNFYCFVITNREELPKIFRHEARRIAEGKKSR